MFIVLLALNTTSGRATHMKIAIIQLYDDGRKGYGDLTGDAASRYCDRHGYTYIRYREMIDPTLIPTWNKLLAVRKELPKFDWVLWLDADALIVNPGQRIEDIIAPYESGKDMLFSTDDQGLCGHLYEQKTIRTLFEQYPTVKEKIGLIPDSVIHYPYSQFNPHAFIMHYWAISNPFEQAEINMRNIVKHGWAKPFMR